MHFHFIIQKKFHKYGFRRISTPSFEEVECFERSFGKSADIIQKELYTFEDKLEELASNFRNYKEETEYMAKIQADKVEKEIMDLKNQIQQFWLTERICYNFSTFFLKKRLRNLIIFRLK
jgi:hypothetical protein